MKNYNLNLMKNLVLNLLIINVIFLMSGCNLNTEPASIEVVAEEVETMESSFVTNNQFKSAEMLLGKMEMQTFNESIETYGTFEVAPEYTAEISTYFAGKVTHIKLLPGEYIKKGQLLMILENPDFVEIQQDYLEARGQLSFLKSDFERQQNLAFDNVTSQKNYLQAASNYEVMQVKVAALAKKLSLMGINVNSLASENIKTTLSIYSPINGYVSAVNVARGTFLEPSQTAMEIIDIHQLHLSLNIFEEDITKVFKGQQVVFKLQNSPSKEYNAEIELISKTIDAEKRTIGIHAKIKEDKKDFVFSPGMYVEAKILSNVNNKIAIPKNALVEVEGQYFVLVLDSKTNEGYSFIKKEVQAGLSDNSFVEILNQKDFSKDDQFLINGAFNLILE